jgi:hypothetical protein
MIDYCNIVKERKEKIEENEFKLNGVIYQAEINWAGSNPYICMRDGKSNLPLLFIIHPKDIFICNPEEKNSTDLKNQLEIILHE